jgi:hypothetical protein
LQQPQRCANGPAIAFRHRHGAEFCGIEKADLLVFVAYPAIGRPAIGLAEIGDDQHSFAGKRFKAPTVQNGVHAHIDGQLLADLPDHTRFRILAEFQATARQFPFVPFVLEQRDAPIEKQHALD